MIANFQTQSRVGYRLLCQGQEGSCPLGCSGNGPVAGSKLEAIDIAIESGWRKLDGRWICPGHVEAKEKADAER